MGRPESYNASAYNKSFQLIFLYLVCVAKSYVLIKRQCLIKSISRTLRTTSPFKSNDLKGLVIFSRGSWTIVELLSGGFK